MTAEILSFPGNNIGDIPASLRNLADAIERGDHDQVHNLVWAIDCGDFEVRVGMMGESAAPGSEAHLLLAIAQRRLEGL